MYFCIKKTMEVWKNTYYPNYEVSNVGNVRRNNRLLKLNNAGNYVTVKLSVDGKTTNICVHRLVAETFIDNPKNKPEIDHIDGNRTNNNSENLRWCTHIENCNNENTRSRNARKGEQCNWYGKKGIDNHNSKPVFQYDMNMVLINKWDCINDAERAGYFHSNIVACCKGRIKSYKKSIWRYEKEN